MPTVKDKIGAAFVKLGYPPEKIKIAYPAKSEYGDYATSLAMILAKEKKQPAMKLASDLVNQLTNELGESSPFRKIEADAPGFVNFFIKDEILQHNLAEIIKLGDNYGKNQQGRGKKIIVEYSSPNTNKPLHLGHLRNNFLGMALGNLLKSQGFEVSLTEIINDRGVHICKSMLAYQMFGQGDSPEKSGLKGDHFVGKYYVLYAEAEKQNAKLADKVQELLRKWEAGDKDTRELWRRMNDWAESGYSQTYAKIGSHFDRHEYESEIYDKGKDIIVKAKQRGLVEETTDGALAVDLSEYNLGGRADGKKILVRADGTSVYMTQDLYLAIRRWQEYHPDKVFYVVGDEQIYHFKVLFKILEFLGYMWAKDSLIHFSYGMVNLPEGRMKSREGTVVEADDLLAEVEGLARQEIKKRETEITAAELTKRAEIIALAALKFFILKVDVKSHMTYNSRESVVFEGSTGPYLLYTYARLRSIEKKSQARHMTGEKADYEWTLSERQILILLLRYPEVLGQVTAELKPHYLAEYLFELSAKTNAWYVAHQVLGATPPAIIWRLELVRAILSVLEDGLKLLNIELLQKM
jgi:arginyl-tRNA synthetase